MYMPDIQAGEVEVTQKEASEFSQGALEASNQMRSFMFVDELGEAHEDSAEVHLGRS